jgi:hypothetical protein
VFFFGSGCLGVSFSLGRDIVLGFRFVGTYARCDTLDRGVSWCMAMTGRENPEIVTLYLDAWSRNIIRLCGFLLAFVLRIPLHMHEKCPLIIRWILRVP